MPKSILIVQIGKIGDMILTTPLFNELKRLFPISAITVLAGNSGKEVLQNNPNVDKIIIYKKSFLCYLNLYSELRNKYELWIDTKKEYSRTSEILLKICRPKLSLGYNSAKNIFDVGLNKYQEGNHAVDINLSPVNYFTGTRNMLNLKPEIFLTKDNIYSTEKYFIKNSDVINTLINVSAGNSSRYLQKEKWVNIINKINNSGNYNFNIIGLKRDSEYINFVLENTLNVRIKYIETKNIIEAAAAVYQSDVVITPDTSIVHICSAFNKPVIALYPDVGWNSERFAPLSNIRRMIISESSIKIDDISEDKITEAFISVSNSIIGGNAESRTRVRKEDH